MAVWTDFRNNSYLGMTSYFPDFADLHGLIQTFEENRQTIV